MGYSVQFFFCFNFRDIGNHIYKHQLEISKKLCFLVTQFMLYNMDNATQYLYKALII